MYLFTVDNNNEILVKGYFITYLQSQDVMWPTTEWGMVSEVRNL